MKNEYSLEDVRSLLSDNASLRRVHEATLQENSRLKAELDAVRGQLSGLVQRQRVSSTAEVV